MNLSILRNGKQVKHVAAGSLLCINPGGDPRLLVWSKRMLFAHLVEKARLRKKWTYRQAAKQIGTSDATLVAIERHGHIPKPKLCARIISTLGLDESEAWRIINLQRVPAHQRKAAAIQTSSLELLAVPVIGVLRDDGKSDVPPFPKGGYGISDSQDVEYMPSAVSDKLYALRVNPVDQTTSANLGDTIFVCPKRKVEEGHMGLVRLKDGRIFYRQVFYRGASVVLAHTHTPSATIHKVTYYKFS